jgi:hypothetical protein
MYAFLLKVARFARIFGFLSCLPVVMLMFRDTVSRMAPRNRSRQ